ncbi:unnamed protein product [Pedinophyceae sp. YPF-701]|nr:unnamed protein product [Pedinophyceae sp. YPF-701]
MAGNGSDSPAAGGGDVAKTACAGAQQGSAAVEAGGAPGGGGAQEGFAACVRPLPKSWNTPRAQKFLEQHDVRGVLSATKQQTWKIATVQFESKAAFEAAQKTLEKVKAADGFDDVSVTEFQRKPSRSRDAGQDDPASNRKKRRIMKKLDARTADFLTKDIRDAVCPLWAMPYPQQLILKRAKVESAMERLTSGVAKSLNAAGMAHGRVEQILADGSSADAATRARAEAARAAAAWVHEARAARSGRALDLEGIVRSPVLCGYRNNNELTIGTLRDGSPGVGFLLGSFVDGWTAVDSADACPHVSALVRKCAAMVQEFVRSPAGRGCEGAGGEGAGPLKVWDKRTHTGFWRQLKVREARRATVLPRPGESYADACGAGGVGRGRLEDVRWQEWLVEGDPWTSEVARRTERGALDAWQPSEGAETPPQDVVGDGGAGCDVPVVDEAMMLVQVNPEQSPSAAATQRACEALCAHVRAGCEALGFPLTTFLVQYHTGVSNAADLASTTFAIYDRGAAVPWPADDAAAAQASANSAETGTGCIEDVLCGLRFRISWGAFFQVNAAAASVLYRIAGDWAGHGARSTVLDVCCGTGTIGLSVAAQCKKVIGVDIAESAVEDARRNSRTNGVQNCEWIAGKAEDVMGGLLPRLVEEGGCQEGDIVAIVDPPRPGLHPSVVRAILGCRHIRRLVYVSCNPETLASNCVELCTPHSAAGHKARALGEYDAFRPVRALAVDLFPHTKHCEAIMLLER